jgi:hypothetical protein
MSVYKTFETDDIVRGNPSEVTTGLWSGETGSLVAFFSSSTQAGGTSGQYYWDVYNMNPSSSDAETQFAVAYGHRTGGGGPTLNDSDTATLATQAVYSQYRNLLLDPADEQFSFGTLSKDHIYVINIYRARIKERLDPGNWQINLSGSNGLFSFVDDSGQSLGTQFGRSGAVFNVVSGSLSGSLGTTIASNSSSAQGNYGLFYPSLGLLVLNPDALTSTVGFAVSSYTGTAAPFAPVTSSSPTFQYNQAGLYRSIKLGADFQARSSEMISSTHYFVRLRNKDFNYTNNPSFFDETTGEINQQVFITDPKTYATTVGLYNTNNELLAVAKTSRPIQKSFDTEVLLRVRLDW